MSFRDPDAFVVKDARFGLRAFEIDDLAALYEIESDPFLKQYVGGPVAKPRAEWMAGCESLLSSDVQFALECLGSGLLAGRVSLGHYASAEVREVQIILAKPFLGRGHGQAVFALASRYAFTSLGASSVAAVVDPAHNASLRLVQALGMSEVAPHLDLEGKLAKRVFVLRQAT